MVRKIYGIIMGFVIQIVCLYKWIPMEKGEVCCLEAFFRIVCSENIRNTSVQVLSRMTENTGGAADDFYAMMLFIFIACLSIAQILCIIYIPFSFFGRGLLLCGISGLIFCAAPLFLASELIYIVDEPEKMLFVAGILLIVIGMNFIVCKLLEQYEEASQEAKRLRERDKEFKRERKRRLRFKGRYSPLFYRIIWENCRSRWSDYVTFIAAGSIAAGFVIAGFGMWTLLKGQELNDILLNFLVISMVISVFLIVNILLFYLKNRMKGYGILLNLGMRRMTLRFYMAVELICCILLSIICGFLLGNGLLFGLKTLLVRGLGPEVITGNMTDKTWLMIFISIGLIFLVSLVITRDNYYNPETSGIADKAVMAEPLGVKHHFLCLVAGGSFVYEGARFFADPNAAESLFFPAEFLLGSYLVLKCLWGIFLRFKKKVNGLSYKTILTDNFKYYRFKTTFRYMFFLAVMHTIILFVYVKDIAATMTAEKPEDLFPYDYVCIADTGDKESFAELKGSGLVEEVTYPMVRVSSPGHADEFVYDMSSSSIGQHIGISETTYRQMCEHAGIKPKELNLAEDGSNVHAIYQQDRAQKAHALGNFLMEENTFLHIGLPEMIVASNSGTWIRKTKAVYEERKIKSQEAFIITGAVHQGSQENIIVFSDAYLERVLAEGETDNETEKRDNGGRLLVLLNLTSEDARPAVEEMLAAIGENHIEDEVYDADVRDCYSKSIIAPQILRERAMKMEVNVFIIVLIIITGFIMFYIKVKAEMEERKKQHTFLTLVGMGPKKRHQMILAEFCSFLLCPLAISTLITGGFLWITLNLRISYTTADKIAYVKTWGKLYIIYVLIQAAGILVLGYYTIRKVDKE